MKGLLEDGEMLLSDGRRILGPTAMVSIALIEHTCKPREGSGRVRRSECNDDHVTHIGGLTACLDGDQIPP